jgi:hypothetical protein
VVEVFAMTVQLPEELLFNGVRSEMRSIPALPPLHPRIMEIPANIFADADDAMLASSACWRGYIGSWEIREGKLFLCGLRGRFTLLGDEALWAEWYSGTLHSGVPEAAGNAEKEAAAADSAGSEIIVQSGVVVETRTAVTPACRNDEDERIFLQLEEFDDGEYDEF